MRISLPRPLILLLGGLFLINLLQAFSTELLYDEAYYWYYSLTPSWGYFDHPPMVGWMIALGTLIFDNELGVRLLSCLLGTGTILLLWMLTDHPEKTRFPREFFVWILSMTLLHAYGFLSLPDTPLLFFTALFLWLYKKFLLEPGFGMSVLLGMCMAALMYSKYHAALVILLVLFSNPGLLRDRYAWIALGVSLICYAPHLYWLYDNDFVSVKFHLFERPNQPYRFDKFTLGFLLNMVALFGLTFPWVYRTLFRFKSQNRTEKALIYLVYGFLLFFFLSSFDRRIQTQWLVLICIPTGVIVAQALMSDPALRKWIWRLGLLNILLLFWLRTGLVFKPVFPGAFETHGNKKWVQNLKTVSGGVPVLFENSYRKASMYQFYSRKSAISFNNAYYRQNQYSIDGSEALVQGQTVFYVYVSERERDLYYLDKEGKRKYGQFMEGFESFRRLRAGWPEGVVIKPESVSPMWVHNPYAKAVPVSKLEFGIAYLDAYKRLQEVRKLKVVSPLPETIPPGDTLHIEVRFPSAEKAGAFFGRAVISENTLPWGINGAAQTLEP